MLCFKEVSLENKEILDRYFIKYGEKSCQHSFVSMFGTKFKYNDMVTIMDDYLYVLRANKETDKERIYLFPMGDRENKDGLKNAIHNIIDDAHSFGKKVQFETVTKSASDLLLELFPNVFISESYRDYFEYIYTYDKLANQSGPGLTKRRSDLKRFFRDYGDRLVEKVITVEQIDAIRTFQKKWLDAKLQVNYEESLILEDKVIDIGLSNYEALGLRGIVVYIDGNVVGYAYGTVLSEKTYDVIIEKGDKDFPNISNLLNRDQVRMCAYDCEYINREEDIGSIGLRKAKMLYQPDILLEKYIVKEL